MKFMLVILITLGASGGEPKTIEMRIPQENHEECLNCNNNQEFLINFVSKKISLLNSNESLNNNSYK